MLIDAAWWGCYIIINLQNVFFLKQSIKELDSGLILVGNTVHMSWTDLHIENLKFTPKIAENLVIDKL